MPDVLNHTAALEQWLVLLKRGDGQRFEQARNAVIGHASLRLEQLARRMLKNYPRLRRWEQTGDVLQNAVVRLHRSLEAIRPESAQQFYGLAATQIRRELIDLSRRHVGPHGDAARHQTDYPQNGDGGIVANQADAYGEPQSLAEWTEFHEAVQRLPANERKVFELHWYEGIDQKQVAAILGVTDRTVKNRWRSAKLLLRALLASEAG